jgi:hypothetical protein
MNIDQLDEAFLTHLHEQETYAREGFDVSATF